MATLNQVSITPTTVLIDPKTGQTTREGFLVFQALIQYAQGTQSASVTTDGVQTLTNKTMSGNSNTFSHIPTDALDSRTGISTKVVTGNAGTPGDLMIWDVNGDAQDGPNLGDVLTNYIPNALVANGVVATVLTGVGPTGAQTTVQTWLQIDDSGTPRYIPCF